MKRSKTPDDFYKEAKLWRGDLARLREIIQTTELIEEIKWGAPCYTLNGKNIVGVGRFKSYFGVWFHQGALLTDKNKVLINAQEGKTKALRQWRMNSAGEIKPRIIKAYLNEAIELARTGREVVPTRGKLIVVPPELKHVLAANKKKQVAFDKLRPGQRREYADYIADAKRAETKQRRIEKIMPMIAAGGGLNDKYR